MWTITLSEQTAQVSARRNQDDDVALGSPTYVGEVTGQMPVVLIETINSLRYELAGFSEEAKRQWSDAHWEKDLQKAFEAGCQITISTL